MRNVLPSLTLALIALIASPAWAVVEEADATLKCDQPVCSTALLAGQNINVGTVEVFFEGNTLRVVYTVDPGNDWSLTETHLYVDGVPPVKAAPGQFPYSHEDLGNVKSDTYEFTYAAAPSGCVYFAAHAVVETIVGYDFDPSILQVDLPDQVTMSVKYPSAGDPAYFETTVTGGTVLDGVYDGWCIDLGRTINQNVNYTANVYSSYEEVPDGTVDKPENLHLVNWVINQGFVGQQSTSCAGTFTYGDVQRAIWSLIDVSQSTAGIGSYSDCRVNEIVDAAYLSGEGYVPVCGGVVAVILVPVGATQVTIAQVTLIEDPTSDWCTPVYESETAWGEGQRFPKSWAMYFDCFCP